MASVHNNDRAEIPLAEPSKSGPLGAALRSYRILGFSPGEMLPCHGVEQAFMPAVECPENRGFSR